MEKQILAKVPIANSAMTGSLTTPSREEHSTLYKHTPKTKCPVSQTPSWLGLQPTESSADKSWIVRSLFSGIPQGFRVESLEFYQAVKLVPDEIILLSMHKDC